MGLAETDGDTDQYEVNDDPIGCSCSDGCLSSACSCVSLGYSSGGSCNHYSSDGHITSWKKFIVECDSSCSCGSSCANRVVQRGSALRLFVSQTEPNERLSSAIGSDSGCGSSATVVDKGLGLYTSESIAAGTFVTEYCGELLSTEEAMRRLSQQPLTAHNYLLVMREHYTFGCGVGDSAQSLCSTYQSAYANVNVTCIDATHIGSRARFVNHTCAREPPPPLVLVPIRTRSQFGCSSASGLCESDAGPGPGASQQQHNLSSSRSTAFAVADNPSSSNSSSSSSALPLPPARAALFAARDISAGEELLFDYSAIVGVGEESAQRSQQTEDASGTPSGNRSAAGSSSRPCLCQSRECRGALPFDPLAFYDSYRSSASASSCSDSRI